jgi:hypothetical protein
MWSKFSGDRLHHRKYSNSIVFSSRTHSASTSLCALAALAGCSTALYDIGPGTQYRREEAARTCSTSSIAPALDGLVAGVGAVFALVGVAVLAQGSDAGASGALVVPGALGGITFAIFMPVSRHGARAIRHCEEERAKPLQPVKPVPPRLAADLAESARNAAHRGDCATARAFMKRVDAIDAAYHADVVAGDASLAACVDVSVVAPPP